VARYGRTRRPLLLEADEFIAVPRDAAEFGQPFAQPTLGEELRDEQRDLVRLGHRGLRQLDSGRVHRPVLGVQALDRILAARRDDPVEHPQILEHLHDAPMTQLYGNNKCILHIFGHSATRRIVAHTAARHQPMVPPSSEVEPSMATGITC
jgi:hypothetical protein